MGSARAKRSIRTSFRAKLVSVVGVTSGLVLGLGLDGVAVTNADERDAGSISVTRNGVTEIAVPHLEDVEHMCALLTGCDRLPLPSGQVPNDLAGCVRALYPRLASPAAVDFSLTLRECGLRASSCGELRSCALRGARNDVCVGRGTTVPVEMCDENGRAVSCVKERVTQVRDCPRGGEQCVVRDGKAFCALGTCDADAPPSCSASGTRIVECKKGRLVSLDCAAFDLTCESSSEGPRCASRTAACKVGAVDRCEGHSTIACFRDHEVRVDCGAAGLGCGREGTSRVGSCAMPTADAGLGAGTCDVKTAARCDGGVLRYCAWGRPRAYVCKSMGFERCTNEGGSARCSG